MDDINKKFNDRLDELQLMLDEGRITFQEYLDNVLEIAVECKREIMKLAGIWTEANQEQAEGRFKR